MTANWTDYRYPSADEIASAIRGWQFVFVAHHDCGRLRVVVIVPYAGHETEEQGRLTAACAVLDGYQCPVEFVSAKDGKWCPQGGWANAGHTAIYAN